jgi:SulP family sulfate permease
LFDFASLAGKIQLFRWLKNYSRADVSHDLVGAAVVSFLFLPQSLAYAIMAGLPAQAGVYASIIPLLGYMVFGTSRVLAIGPVAVIALMTSSALAPLAAAGTPEFASLALTLALLSGIMLAVMGLFRLGFLANFISHSVISGFVMASSLLIALSQVKTILGVPATGATLLELVPRLAEQLPAINQPTLMVGLAAIALLMLVRVFLKNLLIAFGIGGALAGMLARTGPLIAAAVFTVLSLALDLPAMGVATVGALPRGLPAITVPDLQYDTLRALFLPALLMSIIGFVESISVAKTYAAKSRERIQPDNELLGLSAANLLASVSGGMPVSGGFSRSVVNHDAGVRTPIASVFTAVGIALVILFLAPYLAHVPLAVLAATIIVAALSLVDVSVLKETWSYSRSDFAAVAVTILLTLTEGVEIGIAVGVILSIIIHLYKTSKPHVAVVGLVPDTEHFRNIKRHEVVQSPEVLSVRVDESLYFANAAFLEDTLMELVAEQPQVKHLVLICSAINAIDTSALETLMAVNQNLKSLEIKLHLSEVKGPVMDRLRRSHFLEQLTGNVFMTQFQAVAALDPDLIKRSYLRRDNTPSVAAPANGHSGAEQS